MGFKLTREIEAAFAGLELPSLSQPAASSAPVPAARPSGYEPA